jgi:hypothetical protein
MSTKKTDIPQMNSALSQIGEADKATVKTGAEFLHRRARDNWTIWKKEWFAREETIKALLTALRGAEEGTAIELVGALGNASQRYDILDSRIHDALVDRFHQAPDKLRLAVAQAIPHFGTRMAWNLILEALSAKPTAAAHHTVALAVARYGKTIEPAIRPKFAKSLLEITGGQNDSDILDTIAMALAVVGSPEDVPALRSWFDSTKNECNRDTILQAIDACSKAR